MNLPSLKPEIPENIYLKALKQQFFIVEFEV